MIAYTLTLHAFIIESIQVMPKMTVKIEGRQNERQETTNSDKVGRNGETACNLREKVPRPLKKNVSISNMAEEYGFGGSFDPVDFDELFVSSGRYRPKLNHMSRYVGMQPLFPMLCVCYKGIGTTIVSFILCICYKTETKQSGQTCYHYEIYLSLGGEQYLL